MLCCFLVMRVGGFANSVKNVVFSQNKFRKQIGQIEMREQTKFQFILLMKEDIPRLYFVKTFYRLE